MKTLDNRVSIPCAIGHSTRGTWRAKWNEKTKHWERQPVRMSNMEDEAKRVQILTWLESGNGRVVVR